MARRFRAGGTAGMQERIMLDQRHDAQRAEREELELAALRAHVRQQEAAARRAEAREKNQSELERVDVAGARVRLAVTGGLGLTAMLIATASAIAFLRDPSPAPAITLAVAIGSALYYAGPARLFHE